MRELVAPEWRVAESFICDIRSRTAGHEVWAARCRRVAYTGILSIRYAIIGGRLELITRNPRTTELMDNDISPVDVWMQHPTPEFVEHPMFESLLRWIGLEQIPDEIPFEITREAGESADLQTGLLSAWYGPQGPMISNDEVAECIEAAPERFAGIGGVNLNRPMKAVEQVRRCVEKLDFVGIRVLPWLWERPPDHRSYYPVYATCVELGVPFCLQVGHTGPKAPSEYGRPIPYLDRVALDFPDLTIVAGHIGHPWSSEMIALAYKYPNIYIDTSAYKPKRFPDEFVEYMRQTDCKKVMFGSNFPMISPLECLEGVSQLGLSDEAVERFLRDNAVDVFGLD